MITLTTAPEIAEMIEQMKRMKEQFKSFQKMFNANNNQVAGALTKANVINKCIKPAFLKMWYEIIREFSNRFSRRGPKWQMILEALIETFHQMNNDISTYITFEESTAGRKFSFNPAGAVSNSVRKVTFECSIKLIDLQVFEDQDRKMQIANLYIREPGEVIVTRKSKKKQTTYRYPIGAIKAYPNYKTSSKNLIPMWRILLDGSKATGTFGPWPTKTYLSTTSKQPFELNKFGQKARKTPSRRGDKRVRILFHTPGTRKYWFGMSGQRGSIPARGGSENPLFEAKNVIRRKYIDMFNTEFSKLISELMQTNAKITM